MPISPYLKNIRQKVGHELLLVPSVAAVIPNDKGEILVIKRSDDGTWSLPAGAIDPDESPAQAVIREVAEETGLIVEIEKVIGVFGGKDFTWTYPSNDVVQYTVIVFLCRAIGGDLCAVDGEAQELVYLSTMKDLNLQAPYPADLFKPPFDSVLFN
jgi:mutator protein MutT